MEIRAIPADAYRMRRTCCFLVTTSTHRRGTFEDLAREGTCLTGQVGFVKCRRPIYCAPPETLIVVLAAMSACHDYTDAKALQNWLSDVIEHLEALPEPTQIALGSPLFKIGDKHFHWRADQIKIWHKERCRSLRQQLSELQCKQWQSPVGALPSRFGAPQYS